jgi:hypothetical protein
MAPNGTVDDSVWERWLTVFSPIVDDLNEFGGRHGLFVERFYHNAPIWHFVFRKKAGGKALVEIVHDPTPNQFHVGGVWWIDDYETVTRLMRTASSRTLSIPVKREQLLAALKETFETIKGWSNAADLTEKAGPYPEWRERSSSEEDLRRADSKYPLID